MLEPPTSVHDDPQAKVLATIHAFSRRFEKDARQVGCHEVALLLSTAGHSALLALQDLGYDAEGYPLTS